MGMHVWLRQAVGERAHVWVQIPVVLGDLSQPQPDLALIRRKPEGYAKALPRDGDVLLVIDVSDSTLDYDREFKLRLYAKHNIPEYWIVDVEAQRIEVYRDPDVDRYSSRLEAARGEQVSPLTLPSARIDLAAIFD